MPAFSRLLSEEGLAVVSCKIVEDGIFQEERITKLLQEAGGRTIKDNIADLKAQIASNTKGISLIKDLIDEYSLDVVLSYMQYVKDNAEYAVREMLQKVFEENATDKDAEKIELRAEDFMDDGSNIKLNLTIYNQQHENYKRKDEKPHVAIFDFRGTSQMVLGNTK